MGSGGARARSGPAPDPNALRRERDQGEWTILPQAGRDGEPPEWPLDGQSDREVELWARLWAKPQAIMWQRYGQELEVALYARNLALVEQPGAPVNLGTLVRQQQDSLGLSTPGMRANRWRIQGEDARRQTPDRPGRAGPKTSDVPSSRERLKLIGGGKSA